MKTIITILFAKLIRKKNKKWISNPVQWQAKTFDNLISSASNTRFGKDHAFSQITSYDEFKKKAREKLPAEIDKLKSKYPKHTKDDLFILAINNFTLDYISSNSTSIMNCSKLTKKF